VTKTMLYYSNGGPGPATRLLRVEVPGSGSDREAWLRAPAASWQPHTGWVPNTYVQLDILGTGDFFMVDESQVEAIQGEMTAAVEKYRKPLCHNAKYPRAPSKFKTKG
jgi:hypothetical protein